MRLSELVVCLRAAPNFLLAADEAEDIIAHQVATIRQAWSELCEEADLSEVDQRVMWRRQILNPFAFQGLPASLAHLADDDALFPGPR